jgi:hypothetical protein
MAIFLGSNLNKVAPIFWFLFPEPVSMARFDLNRLQAKRQSAALSDTLRVRWTTEGLARSFKWLLGFSEGGEGAGRRAIHRGCLPVYKKQFFIIQFLIISFPAALANDGYHRIMTEPAELMTITLPE